ncbi:MAG: UvrD/REP helicase [bacterium]|nr:MAG: UvrD/REP helicase [bacterium]KAF0150508.1 MAG: UvrD/REP helicase [bacterium]TXT32751.1 MAG: UvrD/REP helicase [Rhodocyclaceae bacterium]
MTGKLTFISAGAGSGKTHRLTQILHEQLSSGSVRPSGVVATTFTKKAATELRERVRSHLLKQGAYGLANAMGQARIGTVNSVCGGLLERFAFEAGLATEQQVLEENQAAVLVKQAIDAVLDGPGVSDLLKVVQRLGIEDWQKELKSLLDKARANDIDPGVLVDFARENAEDLLIHFPKPTTEDLSATLLKEIRAAIPILAEAAEAKKVQKTIKYLTLVRSIERGIQGGYAPWSDWVKLSKEQPEAGLKSIAESIGSVAQRFSAHPMLHADISEYLERMFSLCAEALRIYDACKREMGVLDFTDQEHLLLKVLDDASVEVTLKDELDLLLVDEFQDTSPIQLALFLKLANCAKAIYWVGDIKQAIYGFRGSDTELMEAILQALGGMGGSKEILGSSWRSTEPLVQIVNEVFKDAFAGSLKPEEIELKPERKEALPDPAFANWILGGKNKGQEVSALATGIKKLVESGHKVFDKEAKITRPASFGDVAVLCRANDGVKDTAAGLRAFGVPTATSQPGLLATPEAVFSLACLRRLNDPSDSISTAEIVSLADCQEPETWVVNRLQHLEAGGDPDRWMEEGTSPHPLIVKLAGMRSSLPLLAPREALQAVITDCEIPDRALRWSQNSSVARIRLANLEAILEMADKYEDICRSAQHAASISGLILWFNEQAGAEQDNLAEPAIDAVKVMTHHGAKGLEWPVVVLLDIHTDVKDNVWSITAASRSGIQVTDPLRDRFIRYWPWPFGAQKTVPLADEIALSEVGKAFRASAIEESRRLLYVSMTRARDLLVLARSQRKLSGEWLDTLGAPWLLPADEQSNLVLPSGNTIDAIRWGLDPVEIEGVLGSGPEVIHWYQTSEQRTNRLPLVLNPSTALPPECLVAEQVRVGERIGVASGTDMGSLGSAIHACIAASLTDRAAPLSLEDVDLLLRGFDVEGSVSAKAILSQVQALHDWISARWGNAAAFAEIPVEAVTDASQIIQGRIDLLLELADGWILIDHKSNPRGAEQWESIAKDYAGQLATYKGAVERATGKTVLESWLFFPVAAGAVRVKLLESAPASEDVT